MMLRRRWSSKRPPSHRRSQDGFALVSVIWAIGLIAILFATYIATARYRLVEATHLLERARAEGLAQAAVNLGLLDLLEKRSHAGSSGRGRWNGSSVHCTLGGSRMRILVTDEGGKIDLNNATQDLLAAVIGRVSPDRGTTALIVGEIMNRREVAAEAQRARGLAHPDAPTFRTLFELDQLPGMNRSLLQTLRPMLTVHSGSAGFDPQVAPPAILATLGTGGRSISRAEAAGSLPASYLATSPSKVFQISGEVVTGSGTLLSQEAIVEFSAEAPYEYTIREWRTGGRSVFTPDRSAVPPC